MSNNLAVHFLSQTDDWETPQSLFNRLDAEFYFTLDVCATPANTKCPRYFTKGDDGLRQSWSNEICWMNPPYGREIGKWLNKAFVESVYATVVCLVPARTDTRWWHDYCMRGEIRFVRGRLKFGESFNSAPFPSAIVIFRRILGELEVA